MGAMRWVLFFAVIVLAGAGVTALWGGFSPELLKAVATFAIVALGALALFALGARK